MTTRLQLGRSLIVMALFVAAIGAATAGTMSVAWDSVSGSAGYKVYYGTAQGAYTQYKDVPGASTTSTTLTGLDACTRYYVAVKAYDSAGLESATYSNEIVGLPRPVVSGVNPASGEQGSSITVVVSGESFDSGAVSTFGAGITVLATRRDSCSQVSVDIQIAADAVAGVRTVEVQNPDRSYGALANAFTVVANAAPSVASAAPAAGATNVAVDVRPQVIFSEAMSAASITASTVQLRTSAGAAVAQASGSPVLAADGRTVTITPAANLNGDASYYLWVRGTSAGVKDASGKAMAADWQQSPAWRTGTAPDTEPPTVSSTNPAAGASNVPVGVKPSVTFSEAMQASTITSATIRLLNASGQAVAQAAGSPQLSADGKTATITPAAALAENAVYRIQVVGGSAGAKDLAGNPLASNYDQSPGFTCENLPPSAPANLRRTDVR